MTKISSSSSLEGTIVLWRYMSLDKFVDLLAFSRLYFSPLASFVNTDPFEGYLPEVALRADSAISRKIDSDTQALIDTLKELLPEAGGGALSAIEAKFQEDKRSRSRFFSAIRRCITVNCWHANEYESEAMWRLYSESGKAVAIETTADSLKAAIEAGDSAHLVHIHPVKYVDFFDPTLRPADCVVGGHRAPLLKRISYAHEKEVRAFINRRTPDDPREMLRDDFWEPSAIMLPVDVNKLINRVHISPYPTAPFESSVRQICAAFRVNAEIVQRSGLLTGSEDLLRVLDL
jgi:hypothetical protein